MTVAIPLPPPVLPSQLLRDRRHENRIVSSGMSTDSGDDAEWRRRECVGCDGGKRPAGQRGARREGDEDVCVEGRTREISRRT